jgi:hypothetical protein
VSVRQVEGAGVQHLLGIFSRPCFGVKLFITTGTAQYPNKKARGTFRKYSDMGDTKNGFSVAKESYEKSYTVSVPHSLIFEGI